MQFQAQLLGKEFGDEYSGDANSEFSFFHGGNKFSIALRGVPNDPRIHEVKELASWCAKEVSAKLATIPQEFRPSYFQTLMLVHLKN
jgi:hypothetical protein